MPALRRTISVGAARSLDLVTAGPEDGTPLVVHHGTPGARIDFEPFVAAAVARGLRYVSYSRPGYGDSTRTPGRTVADGAGEVLAVLEHLHAPRCYTLGWSGGGPYALACAALIAEHVIATATIAAVAPRTAEDLDWTAGMGPENVEEFSAALAGPDALEPYVRAYAAQLSGVTGEQMVEALGGLLSDVDKAALTGALGDFLAANMREGLSRGMWGWFDDDLAGTRSWGFDLATVSVPVAVWQGRHDRMVPFGHGAWLAAHVPGARARLEPEHGHLSLAVGAFDRVLGDLVQN
jgi:pimeloyl-ACP methyl ester carboxylesterase